MKKWIAPNIEIEDIKDTAAGGGKPTRHDGFIWERTDGNRVVMVEEYFPVS